MSARARASRRLGRRGPSLLLAAGVLFLLAPSACTDDDPSYRPEIAGGRIRGHVRSGGVALDATVMATRAPDGDQTVAIVNVEPGPNGAYSMDVPAGRYVVGLRIASYAPVYEYSAAGLRFGDAPPDTLLVDETHAPTVDFDLASLHVRADLSPRLDGEEGHVVLHRRGGQSSEPLRSYVGGRTAAIEGGVLEVTVRGVLPGDYKVELVLGPRQYLCYCPYDGEHVWIPGVRDSSASPWVDVAPDRRVEISVSLDPEPARIEGEITGAWQDFGFTQPPALALVAPDSSFVRGFRIVENDGTFAEELFLPGPVKLAVLQQEIVQWIGGRSFRDAQVFELETGRTVSGVRFVQSGLRLEIGGPFPWIEHTWFRLYDPTDLSLVAAWWMQNAAGLVLPMSNLRPGTYLMQIEPYSPGHVPWAPQWFDRARRIEDARPITIAREGEIVPVAITLEKGGTISGTVHDREGSWNYFIYVTPSDDRREWGYHYAWDPGRVFEVVGLPDGEWKIGAWRRVVDSVIPEQPPRDTVWYPGTTDWQEAQAITIHDFSDVVGIEIAMEGSREMLARQN